MRTGEVSRGPGPAGPRLDVGTLWTLELDTHTARCSLVWVPHAWELSVHIDDELLLSERCRTQAQVLTTAGGWATRLRHCGWTSPTSAPADSPADSRRYS